MLFRSQKMFLNRENDDEVKEIFDQEQVNDVDDSKDQGFSIKEIEE